MEELSLLETMQAYSQEGQRAFHMPGHKRNTALAPYLKALRADLDVTEIPGFDSLDAPTGLLRRLQERAARLRGAKAAFLSVSGST